MRGIGCLPILLLVRGAPSLGLVQHTWLLDAALVCNCRVRDSFDKSSLDPMRNCVLLAHLSNAATHCHGWSVMQVHITTSAYLEHL